MVENEINEYFVGKDPKREGRGCKVVAGGKEQKEGTWGPFQRVLQPWPTIVGLLHPAGETLV